MVKMQFICYELQKKTWWKRSGEGSLLLREMLCLQKMQWSLVHRSLVIGSKLWHRFSSDKNGISCRPWHFIVKVILQTKPDEYCQRAISKNIQDHQVLVFTHYYGEEPFKNILLQSFANRSWSFYNTYIFNDKIYV